MDTLTAVVFVFMLVLGLVMGCFGHWDRTAADWAGACLIFMVDWRWNGAD